MILSLLVYNILETTIFLASSILYINIETTKTITSIIVWSNNTLHLAPPKLPTVQNIAFLAWFEFLAAYIKRFVIAPNIIEIALPIKTNLVVDVDLPICVPIANTNTPKTIEPTNAPTLIVFIPIDEIPPKTITATAPAMPWRYT